MGLKLIESTGYVEYNLDELNHTIYNDLPLNNVSEEIENYYATMDILVDKDEDYAVIKGLPSGCHFITSKGRVINAKRKQQMTIFPLRGGDLMFLCDRSRWKILELMVANGWKTDKSTLLAYYKKIEYPIVIHKSY